ncbi:3-hydroxyacyl-CoA dehydrogenase family protein [Candidatus Bathyarchaeota archaeon]|nr:3-hydroxyacyl-CoA dehydrogenase family protein [Candidatus Bathyarchaeota archaeon]
MGSSIITRDITRVACVGAGVMGHSWATLFAVRGYRVTLQDVSEDNLDRAMAWMRTALELMAEKEVIQESEVEPALSRVHPTTDLGEAVGEADFVLESVYEDYGVKREVFREMDAHAPEESILATGSSRLLITEIQKATERPERCIGAHGFNPPHLVPLVEIVPGEATSPETVEGTRALMEGLGKTPIVVRKEVAGYLGNRIQGAVLQAARDIVESGIATVEEVDLAVSTGIGLRWALYGPFAVTYFNTPSHLIDRYGLSGLVAEGFQEHSLMKGKTFDEMVRWRNDKLIEMLRVLEYLP